MQGGQSVNWLALLAPTVITSFVLVVTQVVVAGWLSRRTERYKRDLSEELGKKLETHRIQLQSEFQTKLYEFQTRYSLLHQKRAEAIEKLFELLVDVQNDLQVWAHWQSLNRKETKEEFYTMSRERFQRLIEFYDRKRIYFDRTTVGIRVTKIVSTVTFLSSGYDSIESLSKSVPEFAEQMKTNARNIIDDIIHPLMNELEDEFKRLLSAETHNQLERKS